MKVQICLVSEQAAANILPALDATLKPDCVLLVVSAAMSKRANHLQSVLKENSIQKVEQFKLNDETSFHKMEEDLLELADRWDGNEITLNITGGTKLMALAAQSVAHTSDWRIFYLDANTDTITWLPNQKVSEKMPPPCILQDYLRLPHYLKSYGFDLSKKPDRINPTPAQKRATEFIVQNAAHLENAISILNALAQDAENRSSLQVQMSSFRSLPNEFFQLLNYFSDAQVLTRQGDNIAFSNTAGRDFVKGGWLEFHVIDAIHYLTRPLKIRDKAIGLEVVENSSQTKNELDIAFLVNNRLHVIECKTGRIDKPHGNKQNATPPKANDTLFKLSANCRRIGGLATRGMLISYRKLGHAERQLADALGIFVVAGSDLARLPEKITNWVKSKSGA